MQRPIYYCQKKFTHTPVAGQLQSYEQTRTEVTESWRVVLPILSLRATQFLNCYTVIHASCHTVFACSQDDSSEPVPSKKI